MTGHNASKRPAFDSVIVDIAKYVDAFQLERAQAYKMARYCTIDALGCAFDALSYPECTKLLGPVWPGAEVRNGARVPGTQFELNPVNAAFNLSTMIRWTDFNDTFYAVDVNHPSDNLGGILALADAESRRRIAHGEAPLVMRDVLTAMIKSYEIQCGLVMCNKFSVLGLDHTALNRIGTTAVLTKMLGGGQQEIMNAVSNAFADGFPLKAYRQAPNTGSRKSWAGADAASRAVFLAILALKGEPGYPTVLTDPTWGLYRVLLGGEPFKFDRPFESFVIENVTFKFAAAGTHSQSALECAQILHPKVKDRIADIAQITVRTHDKMIRIMDKTGPLHNQSDRDHCAQYIIAVGLIQGKIDSACYDDDFASDPRIDALREKMTVIEDERYTRDQNDVTKLSNACTIQIQFKDGSAAEEAEIEYPKGHPKRQAEAIPMIEEKFSRNLAKRFPARVQPAILEMCFDQDRFESMPVQQFMDRLVI